MTEIRRQTVKGLREGNVFSRTRTFTESDTVRFAEISRDHNPVHFDERFSRAKKLRGPICHGLLVAGLLTEIGGQIGWLASRMDFRFLRPVYFGDTITCRLTIQTIDARGRAVAESTFTNQSGDVVIKAGLFGILPQAEERRILQDILESEAFPGHGAERGGKHSGPE
jgi:3-hydroxybutyryl-CoA dehydratase